MLPHLETCATHRLVAPPRQPTDRSITSLFTSTDHSFSSLCFPLPLVDCRSPAYESFSFAVQLSKNTKKFGGFSSSALTHWRIFEFNPIQHGMSSIVISETEVDVLLRSWNLHKEPMDLSKIISLKRFTVCLTDHNEMNYTPWLTGIISPVSDNRRLEETCAGDQGNNTWWHGAFDVLWQGEFKSLKQLTIFFNFESMSGPTYGEDLYNHEYTELRSQCGRRHHK